MSDWNEDQADNAMFWFNLIGACIVIGLVGAFFWLNGSQLLGLMIQGFAAPPLPGR